MIRLSWKVWSQKVSSKIEKKKRRILMKSIRRRKEIMMINKLLIQDHQDYGIILKLFMKNISLEP